MSILDKYDQQRRQKYHTVTDVVSTTNLKRLFLPGEDALLLDPGLQRFEQTSRDLAMAKELFEVRIQSRTLEQILRHVEIGIGQSHSGHDSIL